MALDFRLSYNNGFEYVDLFPKTEMIKIIGSENVYTYKIKTIIPFSASGYEVKVELGNLFEIDVEIVSFWIKNIVTTTQGIRDYNTIIKAEFDGSTLTLTRSVDTPITELGFIMCVKGRGTGGI